MRILLCTNFKIGNNVTAMRLLQYGLLVCALAANIAQASPFVYVGNHNSADVTVIDAATNTVITTISGIFRPYGTAITPDGTRAYVTSYGYTQSVSIINTATNALAGTVTGVGFDPGHIAFTPDGTRAYVANRVSNSVSVVDVASNTVIAEVVTGDYPIGIAITPDGKYAYVANQTGRSIVKIDTVTNAIVSTINNGEMNDQIVCSADGSRLYVVNHQINAVSVIDTLTHARLATIPTGGTNPYWLVLNPSGSRAYVTNMLSASVAVIDTSSKSLLAVVPVGGDPFKLAITPTGDRVYVANSADNTVTVIDTQTNTGVATIPVGSGPLAVAITPFLAPNLQVEPASYSFGDVLIGTTASTPITLTNSGNAPLKINTIHTSSPPEGNPFVMQLPSVLPLTLSPNTSINVGITYSPSLLLTPQTNSLVIASNDPSKSEVAVALSGQGILAVGAPHALTELSAYMNYAIENRLIVGSGTGASADNRATTLKTMIDSVGTLIERNAISAACGKLETIYQKVDGSATPPDFATGQGVPGFGAGVLSIMNSLNCSGVKKQQRRS